MKLNPMDRAPKDRKVLLAFPGEKRLYCGSWVTEEHAGRSGPFWASDRIHAIGIRGERSSQPIGWLSLPNVEWDGHGEETVPKNGAFHWVETASEKTVAVRTDGAWLFPGWEVPVRDAEVTVLSDRLEEPHGPSSWNSD